MYWTLELSSKLEDAPWPAILQRMTSCGMTTNIKKVDDRAAHFGQPLSFALCTILCFPYIIYI